MNKGQKLWKRAINVIAGGNGLLSKRPDRYAPDIWPAYFSKAKGINVWDLDGNKYIDMAQMGLGSSILGYSNSEIDDAVKEAIDNGINTTLNAPEEVYLAEKLLQLNPFAGSVKFARSGGEAMSIAVRIARASSNRDKIAFSGYHGWCDWYISTNLTSENNLSPHLLPGLSSKGVPKGLANTAIPFLYNNIKDFKSIIDQHDDIGVIVIEGARYDFPTKDFLDNIMEVAKKKNIVIIVDEISSGWRITDGGVYKTNNFEPDIVVYGKALGNGYAISAIVGKYEVMDVAQETFISSTFWTERVGFVAALKTIEVFTREKVWEHLIKVGTKIGEGWLKLAKKYNIKLQVTDFKPLITMKFDYGKQNSAIITLFIQEMLKRGYLTAPSVYVSYAHNTSIVDNYLNAVDEVFKIIANAIDANSVKEKLETGIRDEGFKRLN